MAITVMGASNAANFDGISAVCRTYGGRPGPRCVLIEALDESVIDRWFVRGDSMLKLKAFGT